MQRLTTFVGIPLMVVVVVLLGGFALWVVGAPLPAGYRMGPWMMGGGGMLLMPYWLSLLMLVIGALVIAGLVLVALGITRAVGSRITFSPNEREMPVAILKARFAKGEITQAQFDEMRKILET